MCGIAGYIGSKTIDPRRIDACLGAMQHRGPDASNQYHHSLAPDHHVYLLHTRLSIIDIDPRADQPFKIGPHVLTFNGELYDYLERKRKLETGGTTFRTDSDTEVLLQQLIHHGIGGLDECEGMWAFALYDERAGSLLLCRDRFGEKPLYLFETDGGLFFGSEIKFVKALLDRPLQINYDHLYRYMVNGYKALYKTGAGFFCGVKEVEPGTALTFTRTGAIKQERYWQPVFGNQDDLSFDDVVSQVRDGLIRSMRLRLRADVPLAFLMSGGVDSNALISIAKRVLDYDVHGFTIVDHDKRYDEQAMVEHSVQQLGIRHTTIHIDKTDFLSRLRQLIVQHDAPVYTISYYAQWLLMQAIAAHGYRISISGTGADELFTGYYDHHNAYLYEVRNDRELYNESIAAWRRHIQPIVRNPHLANAEAFIHEPKMREHIFFDADAFAEFLIEPWREPFTEQRYCDGLLRNRMLNELFHEAVPPILHEDDHNAMSQSIENRSPFLDRELFDLSQRIPTRHLISNGYAKAVLRQAMRGIVPDRILDERRKVGFNASINSFIDFTDDEVRSAILDDSPIFEHVRREKIESLLTQNPLPNSKSKFLFYFLSSKMFVEEFGG
ncbi:MAG: asparagine synthase (glutamine-hydrolyzing) [Planctomycetes bacterium]|nr:asparagine synthase (glutamine-hydrolyzing) [Planctomycetota bacterium]